ncbi:hypothetical protein VNPA120661_17100 [Pseudomonas aeruginosa]|nr:hypothetical protein VNPA120661_17100 [Pseudomonas aeruginosa]GLF25089.1 hypothetical protein VNPA131463_59290 [Pseudomonas aeruginosa]GLF38626.1 hypothetical protein VNPA141709_13770 [Pseudomonas aeruginosa]GLF72034.1 hypothetical protein VNPA152080_34560 [Pseudomonas aeruginosa]
MRGREQRQGIAAERDQDVRHALNGNAQPCPHFDPFQGMEEAEESPEALLYGFEHLIGGGVPVNVENRLLVWVFDIGRD